MRSQQIPQKLSGKPPATSSSANKSELTSTTSTRKAISIGEDNITTGVTTSSSITTESPQYDLEIIDYAKNTIIHHQHGFIINKLHEIFALMLQIERFAKKSFTHQSTLTEQAAEERKLFFTYLKHIKDDITTTIQSIVPPDQKSTLHCDFTPTEFIDFCYAFYKPRIRHIIELIKLILQVSDKLTRENSLLMLAKITDELNEKDYHLEYPKVYFSQRFYNPDLKDSQSCQSSKHIEKSTISYKAAALYCPLHTKKENRSTLAYAETNLEQDTTFLTVQIFPGRFKENPDELIYFAVNNRTYAQHCIRGITPRFIPTMPQQYLLKRLSEISSGSRQFQKRFGEGIQPEKPRFKHFEARYQTEICGLKLLYETGFTNVTYGDSSRYLIVVPEQPYSLADFLHLNRTNPDNTSEKSPSLERKDFLSFFQLPVTQNTDAPRPLTQSADIDRKPPKASL